MPKSSEVSQKSPHTDGVLTKFDELLEAIQKSINEKLVNGSIQESEVIALLNNKSFIQNSVSLLLIVMKYQDKKFRGQFVKRIKEKFYIEQEDINTKDILKGAYPKLEDVEALFSFIIGLKNKRMLTTDNKKRIIYPFNYCSRLKMCIENTIKKKEASEGTNNYKGITFKDINFDDDNEFKEIKNKIEKNKLSQINVDISTVEEESSSKKQNDGEGHVFISNIVSNNNRQEDTAIKMEDSETQTDITLEKQKQLDEYIKKLIEANNKYAEESERLLEDLKQAIQTNITLRTENENLAEKNLELKDLAEKNLELEKQVEILINSFQEARSYIEELNKYLVGDKFDINNKKELKEKVGFAEYLLNLPSVLNTEKQILINYINRIKEINIMLQDDANFYKKNNEELKEENKNLSNWLQNIINNITQFNEDFNNKRENFEKNISPKLSYMGTRIIKIEEQIVQLGNIINEKNTNIGDLKRQLSEEKGKVEKDDLEIKELKGKIHTAEEDIKSKQDKIKELENHINSILQIIYPNSNLEENLDIKIAKVKKGLADKQRVEQDNEKLLEAIKALGLFENGIEGQSIDQISDNLKNKVGELKQKEQQLEKANKIIEQQNAAFKIQAIIRNKKLDEFSNKISDLNNKISDLNNKISDLEKQADDDKEKYNNIIKSLEQDIQLKIEEIDKSKNKSNEYQKQITELKNTLSNIKNLNKTSIENIKQAIKSLGESQTEKIQDLLLKAQKFENKIQENEKKLKELETEKQDLVNQNENLKQEKNTIEGKNKSLMEYIKNLNTDYELANKEILLIQKEFANLENKLKNYIKGQEELYNALNTFAEKDDDKIKDGENKAEQALKLIEKIQNNKNRSKEENDRIHDKLLNIVADDSQNGKTTDELLELIGNKISKDNKAIASFNKNKNDLAEQLKVALNEVRELKEEIKRVKENIAAIKQNPLNDGVIKQVMTVVDGFNEEFKKNKKEIKQLQEQITEQEQQHKVKIGILETEKQSVNDQLAEQKIENEKLKSQIKDAEGKLKASEDERSKLLHILQDLRIAEILNKDTFDKKIQELLETINNNQKEKQEFENKLNEIGISNYKDAADLAKQINDKVAEKDREIKTFKNNINSLNEQLKRLEQDNIKLNEEKRQLNDEIEKQSEQISKYEALNKKQADEIKELKNQVQQLQSEKNEIENGKNKTLQELKKEIDKLKQEIDKNREKVGDILNNFANAASQKNKEVEEKILHYRNIISNLEQELDNVEKCKNELEKEIAKVSKSNEEINEENSRLQKQLKGLEAANKSRQEDIDKYKNQLSSLEEENNKLKQQLNDNDIQEKILNIQINELNRQINSDREVNESKQREYQQLLSDKDKVLQENKILIDKLQENALSAKESNENLKKELDKAKNDLQKLKKESDDKISELNDKINEANITHSGELDALKNQLKQEKDINTKLQKEIDNTILQLENAKKHQFKNAINAIKRNIDFADEDKLNDIKSTFADYNDFDKMKDAMKKLGHYDIDDNVLKNNFGDFEELNGYILLKQSSLDQNKQIEKKKEELKERYGDDGDDNYNQPKMLYATFNRMESQIQRNQVRASEQDQVDDKVNNLQKVDTLSAGYYPDKSSISSKKDVKEETNDGKDNKIYNSQVSLSFYSPSNADKNVYNTNTVIKKFDGIYEDIDKNNDNAKNFADYLKENVILNSDNLHTKGENLFKNNDETISKKLSQKAKDESIEFGTLATLTYNVDDKGNTLNKATISLFEFGNQDKKDDYITYTDIVLNSGIVLRIRDIKDLENNNIEFNNDNNIDLEQCKKRGLVVMRVDNINGQEVESLLDYDNGFVPTKSPKAKQKKLSDLFDLPSKYKLYNQELDNVINKPEEDTQSIKQNENSSQQSVYNENSSSKDLINRETGIAQQM